MEERFRNLDYQNWKPVRTLGTDSYGTVYEIARDDGFGMVDHAALKVLSIPAAPEDFDALVAEGRTPEEVTALLHRQVETIARQLMAVDAISDEPNLLRCEDHVIREHPDGRGWDIYVRTELLPSLPDYLRNHPHGEADIIRLGAGLCSALETCHRRGIVHGDIKPRNVFVGGGNFNEQVTYKLGDFGMAQFSAVDNTNDFMAPEVLCGAEVSPESDLYSVGMVLYWALNERRIPFVPLPPTAVEASDLAIAREQRLRGDPLPEPLHGSQALKNVVMRACADDPAQRYASVEEFRAALLAVARRAAAAQPQQAQAVRREAPAPKAVAADTFPGSKPKAQRKAVPVESEGAEKPHNAKKTIAIVLGSLVVVALVVLIIVMALQGGKSGVDSITLDHESAEIAPQDTLTLKATVLDASGQELTDETLTWSSSNAAVATVKDGVVTGVTEGKAKITVKAGKRSADCTITVTNDAIEVKSLKLDKDRAEMQIGDSLTLTATMQPANAPDDLVSWASSDPNIATVKKGIVVATSSGSVTITASAGSCTATCQITVQAPSRVDSVTAETASATLDLGGTKIVAGVINEEMKIIGRGKLKTNCPRAAEAILEDVAKAVEAAVIDAGITMNDVVSVGIGTPGSVNKKNGVIEYANNLAFDNVPARDILESRLKKTIYLDNDANCAALGEAKAGAGKGVNSFVAITLGTGVGSGIVIDGKLVTGVNDAAGEMGHMVIVSDGGKVNIREGNGLTYGRITQLAPGTTCPYVATAENRWHAVVVGRRVGWVSPEYSRII